MVATTARSKGEVKEVDLKSGRSFALRFLAYGERRYLTLGFDSEGWTTAKAQEELDNILADVRRGIWIPPKKKKRADRDDHGGATAPEEPALFGPFATELIAARQGQVAEKTTAFEEWGLAHLLPYFADWPLHEIDIPAVDAYRLAKVRESEARARAIERRKPYRTPGGQVMKPLAPTSINKTIDCLQFILGAACEQKLVIENVAKGRKRRMKEPPRRPVHLDTAGQIEALLETAGKLDRDPQMHGSEREAIIATLVFAGPRAHELCNLLWRDVDLANGRIGIGRSKSQAGLREISILPVLHDYLAAHKAASYRGQPEALVFSNVSGGALNKDSLRKGVLIAAFERTDALLEARAQVPLPVGLTAHKLRHTFASLLIACGEDPNSVMAQLGHSDPKFTLRVYSHLMAREPAERSRLKALVRGERVIAREAPLPIQLESSDYELPIMRALVERGGSAPCKEIIHAVGKGMAEQHTSADIERLPSGAPRWEARVRKARSRLMERGWVEACSPRGQWEVSKIGSAKVRRDEKRANPRRPGRESATAPELTAAG
jgi:integrase